MTGHNNRVALALARAIHPVAGVPLILESQELTSPGFHLIAVGVREMIDWRLSVPDAVEAIHAQGGVAIRTYLITEDRTAAGAIEAIRLGRTVAQDQDGRLYGPPPLVLEVERLLSSAPRRHDVPHADRFMALGALLALATVVASGRRFEKRPRNR